MSGLMPAYILRQWTNDGKLLHGGLVHLYESGTLTPKPAYTDHTYSVPLPNPVVLDAGGAADIWLGAGAYRVWITDEDGVQIRPPIDGVTGAGSGIGGMADVTSVVTYDDLRALTGVPDAVYVSGRETPGDGGQGWFQHLPTSTLVDDDGIVLTSGAGSNVYARIFASYIDPRWYGVVYGGSVDQSLAIVKALGGSQAWNLPVLMSGTVFLGQSIVMPGNSQLQTGIDSFFYAGSPITVTVPMTTRIQGLGTMFGANVQPLLSASVADELRLSWFGGATDTERWTKMIASTTEQYSTVIDIDTNVNADTDVPANFAVDFVGGSRVVITGACSIAIRNLVYTGLSPILVYPAAGRCTALTLVAPKVRLEWFGSDANAWDALWHCHRWDLVQSTAYSTPAGTMTYASDISIAGDTGSTWTCAATLGLRNVDITGVAVSGAGSLSASALLAVTNCVCALPLSSIVPAIISDSNIGSIDRIGLCRNTNIVGFAGEMHGDFVGGSIVAVGAITTWADLTISDAALRKTPADDPTKAPLFRFGTYNSNLAHKLTIRGGSVTLLPDDTTDKPCAMVYAADESRLEYDTLYIDNVRQTQRYSTVILGTTYTGYDPEWRYAISNGFVTVVMVGCGYQRSTTPSLPVNQQQRANESAYVCDGVVNDAPYPILAAAQSSQIVTNAATDWRGPAGVTLVSDGTSISTTSVLNLSSDPQSVNTLRWAGPADGSNAVYNAMRAYGGRITLKVELPGGAVVDPNVRLSCVAIYGGIVLKIGAVQNAGVMYSETVRTLGQGFGGIPGSKIQSTVNMWSGTPHLTNPTYTGFVYNYSDVWNDYTRVIPSGGAINQCVRYVIINEGTGTLPAGTKFTLTLSAYVPDPVQYAKFWPKTFAFTTLSGVQQLASSISGSQSYQYKHALIYRIADKGRLELDIARELSSSGGWVQQPVTPRNMYIYVNKE